MQMRADQVREFCPTYTRHKSGALPSVIFECAASLVAKGRSVSDFEIFRCWLL